MKMKNKLDVWVISRVSVFLNESIHSEQNYSVFWYFDDGSAVEVDCQKREINFIDWLGDDKTYYSIVGVAAMSDYTTNDCYTDKK